MASAEAVICGAGIAGAAAAYHLAVRQRVPNVVIVDERPPMTLTSDKGTMAYRNWFDGPDDTMARFVGRSIGILEEMAESSGNVFELSRPGYAFATADPAHAWSGCATQARRLETFGAGAMREHPGPVPYSAVEGDDWHGIPDGADLLLGRPRSCGSISRSCTTMRSPSATLGAPAGWTRSASASGCWRRRPPRRPHRPRPVIGVDTTGGRLRSVRLASGHDLDRRGSRSPLARGLPAVLGMLGSGPAGIPRAAREDAVRRPARRRAATGAVHDLERSGGRARLERGRARAVRGGSERALAARAVSWRPSRATHRRRTRRAGSSGRSRARLTSTCGLRRSTRISARSCCAGSRTWRRARRHTSAKGIRGFVDGGYYAKTPENRPIVGPLASRVCSSRARFRDTASWRRTPPASCSRLT